MYIASLGTYNVEKWKKFPELKFCEPGGGGVFSNKLKMANYEILTREHFLLIILPSEQLMISNKNNIEECTPSLKENALI